MRAEVGCTRNERAPGDRQVDEALAQVSADPERAVMRTHSRTSTLSERRLHVACRRAACGAPTRPDGHRTRRGVTGGPRTHVRTTCTSFSARACAAPELRVIEYHRDRPAIGVRALRASPGVRLSRNKNHNLPLRSS